MPKSTDVLIDHAEKLAKFENAEPNPPSDKGQAALHELRDAAIARGEAEQNIREAVARARASGVSWTLIAAQLGTSRQAAQQRYR